MTKFTKAVQFASLAHDGQFRKFTEIPYIVHPMEVASIVATITTDEDVLCAAVLHDTVENTPVTIDEIEREFGSRVAALVADESENKREGEDKKATWLIRKQESLDHLKNAPKDALLICLGDKLANLRAINHDYNEIGDNLWKRFNASPENMAWYYSEVRLILSERLERSSTLIEYENLVDKVFGKFGI